MPSWPFWLEPLAGLIPPFLSPRLVRRLFQAGAMAQGFELWIINGAGSVGIISGVMVEAAIRTPGRSRAFAPQCLRLRAIRGVFTGV